VDQEQPQLEVQAAVPPPALEPAPVLETPIDEGQNTVAPDGVDATSGSADAKVSATPHRNRDGWLTTVQSLMVTVTIAVFVITFIVQAFEIPSPSMEKTLLIGDYLLVDKTANGSTGAWHWMMPSRTITRGDIVVFHYPRDPKQHFVKRVIGLPGDRVRLRHKRVFVNGVPQYEPFAVYIDKNEEAFRDDFPNGNRLQAGIDSTWYLQLDKLVEDGQLIVPADHYFVMGDNRDDSSDSRYWGFVPKDNIVGRPLLIYFSLGSKLDATKADDDDDALTQDDKLSVRTLLRRITHDIRWRRVLRLVN
jgi:signal peptidase I